MHKHGYQCTKIHYNPYISTSSATIKAYTSTRQSSPIFPASDSPAPNLTTKTIPGTTIYVGNPRMQIDCSHLISQPSACPLGFWAVVSSTILARRRLIGSVVWDKLRRRVDRGWRLLRYCLIRSVRTRINMGIIRRIMGILGIVLVDWRGNWQRVGFPLFIIDHRGRRRNGKGRLQGG